MRAEHKRVKSVTTLDIRKAPGRSEPLENRVPLFRASRPGGYEKYEIWFSRILNGVQAVSLVSPAVSLPQSRARAIVAPHAYRGRISRPRVALCQPGSRTLSIEKTAKQVLERERVDLCPPCPFQLHSFQEAERKKTLSRFLIEINRVGIQLYTREPYPAACPVADVGTRSGLGHTRGRSCWSWASCRAPVMFSRVFLRRAWSCVAFSWHDAAARFTFRETPLRRFSHPRGLLGTLSPSSS